MLKIEVIKFEAQDVITASTPACKHMNGLVIKETTTHWTVKCDDCGEVFTEKIPENLIDNPQDVE